MRIKVGFRLGLEPINQEGYGDGKTTTTRKTDANQYKTVNPMPRFLVPNETKTKGDEKRGPQEAENYAIDEGFLIMSPSVYKKYSSQKKEKVDESHCPAKNLVPKDNERFGRHSPIRWDYAKSALSSLTRLPFSDLTGVFELGRCFKEL